MKYFTNNLIFFKKDIKINDKENNYLSAKKKKNDERKWNIGTTFPFL